MKFLWVLMGLLLMACLPKLQEEAPISPYYKEAMALIQSGHQAMQHQHWQQAKTLFSRAKVAAELADNTRLLSASWYNLGMAYVGAGKTEHALRAFTQAKKDADETGSLRIELARLLLTQSSETLWLESIRTVTKPWSVDINLSAARLAQQQDNITVAKEMYHKVLSRQEKDAQALSYQAQAWFGLALLHEKKDAARSREQAEQALLLLHQLAQPQLNAHVLWLLYRLERQTEEKMHFAQRACKIYMHLQDQQAIKRCQQTGVRP